jgi:hypothetical protein
MLLIQAFLKGRKGPIISCIGISSLWRRGGNVRSVLFNKSRDLFCLALTRLDGSIMGSLRAWLTGHNNCVLTLSRIGEKELPNATRRLMTRMIIQCLLSSFPSNDNIWKKSIGRNKFPYHMLDSKHQVPWEYNFPRRISGISNGRITSYIAPNFLRNMGNSCSGSWLFWLLPKRSRASAFYIKFLHHRPFFCMLKGITSKNGNRVLDMMQLQNQRALRAKPPLLCFYIYIQNPIINNYMLYISWLR